MLCSSRHKPERVCAQRWRESEKKAGEGRRRRRGRWGERAGERAASRVHAASRSGFSEALCLSESVKSLVRTRQPSCDARAASAAVSEGGEQQQGVLTSEDTAKHDLCASRSCRRAPRGRLMRPGHLLGCASAPPRRSRCSVAKSERVSFSRDPLGSARAAQGRAPCSSVLRGPG